MNLFLLVTPDVAHHHICSNSSNVESKLESTACCVGSLKRRTKCRDWAMWKRRQGKRRDERWRTMTTMLEMLAVETSFSLIGEYLTFPLTLSQRLTISSCDFSHRGKWRSMRQVIRRREYQDDVRDRQYEKDEKIELEKQTEQLLQQQMKEMADLEAKQRAAGYLFDDSAHIKVAIGGTGSAATTTPSGALKPKATTAAFGADDDEDVGKKKRTLITLDDSDGLTPSQREERNREKLKALRDQVPKDKSALWATPIAWDSVTEVSLVPHSLPLPSNGQFSRIHAYTQIDITVLAREQDCTTHPQDNRGCIGRSRPRFA